MDVYNKIRELIAQKFQIDINRINPETTLEELEFDSLDILELIFVAEQVYNIQIDNKEYKIITVQDLVDILQEKI